MKIVIKFSSLAKYFLGNCPTISPRGNANFNQCGRLKMHFSPELVFLELGGK